MSIKKHNSPKQIRQSSSARQVIDPHFEDGECRAGIVLHYDPLTIIPRFGLLQCCWVLCTIYLMSMCLNNYILYIIIRVYMYTCSYWHTVLNKQGSCWMGLSTSPLMSS